MKVAVLLSGGVDSSLALALLCEQGYDVTAFYLKIWLEDELAHLGECPWEEDIAYARAVCERYDVPLKILPLQKAYWDSVVAYTLSEIKQGRTPNPDIMCNQAVKFGAFYDAIGDEFAYVATGHYARIERRNGVAHLMCAPDKVKDQTYFLARLSQQQLARAWFPIGHLTKQEVRQAAEQYGLPTSGRKDSQGICFLGKLKFREFIRYHVGDKTGELVEAETGSVLGSHNGFWYYTIGQRQGIGLAGGPWYVVAKEPQTNRVYVSRTYDAAQRNRTCFVAEAWQWIAGAPDDYVGAEVKVRHGPQRHACQSVSCQGRQCHIHVQEPDQGIAAGQFAVMYRGDECIGSGVIAS